MRDCTDGETYISEDDAPRRWWKVPVAHDTQYYARMARRWGLTSACTAIVHIVFYILGRVG